MKSIDIVEGQTNIIYNTNRKMLDITDLTNIKKLDEKYFNDFLAKEFPVVANNQAIIINISP